MVEELEFSQMIDELQSIVSFRITLSMVGKKKTLFFTLVLHLNKILIFPMVREMEFFYCGEKTNTIFELGTKGKAE